MSNSTIPVVGGSRWLDLINTCFVTQKQPVDLLQQEPTLVLWLSEICLEPHPTLLADSQQITTLQRRLISLREICRSVMRDLEEAKTISADTYERLRSFIQAIPLYTDVSLATGKLAERYRGATPTDDILYQIAISVVHTLQTVHPERIRKCEHDDCVLYFADTSKAGKRRWCSMELCGNRQKAASFYRRKNLNPE